jgi:putative membrane protein
MTDLITSWVINALALLVTAFVLPGVHLPTSYDAVMGALYLGISNYSIKPIMSFCSTPVNFVTLGAFSWVVDAVTLLMVSWFTPGFVIDTYLDALLASIFYYLSARGLRFCMEGLQSMSAPTRKHHHD